MIEKPRYVGLDVHKRIVQCCILDAAGKVVDRHRFDNLSRETLAEFACRHLRSGDRVALEVTTNCWIVSEILQPFVAEVVVSNPMQTKAIAQAKVKTDKVDAQVLAQLLRADFLPPVWMPDEATRRLRELTARRAALVGQRTAVRNRIHSTLAVRLIVPPDGKLFETAGVDGLRQVEIDQPGRLMIDCELNLHAAIDQQIAALDDQLARRGYADERVKLLMTLPGVAEALLAALGDVTRFTSGAKAAAYLGLVPSTKQSAVVATARKLVTIAWQMLTTGEPYRYAVPRSTETKLSRLRVKATGKRRRTGPAESQKCRTLLPGGGRTVRSLDDIYRTEGLPERKEPTGGERRVLHETGTHQFVEDLARAKIIPRWRGALLMPD